jgi:hypothetical protein
LALDFLVSIIVATYQQWLISTIKFDRARCLSLSMRSSKFDRRRQPGSATLSKKIVAGLLLVAAVIFIASIIGGFFG